MKITKNVPAAPAPPIVRLHDCGQELRRGERDHDTYRRFGLVARCSCGISYELRSSGFIGWAIGVGFGNHESCYPTQQYWRGLGWSAEQ